MIPIKSMLRPGAGLACLLLMPGVTSAQSAAPDYEAECAPPFCYVSADEWFSWSLGGRLQLDAHVFQNDRNTPFQSDTNMRRARINPKARFGPHLLFDFTYEFAREGIEGIRDAVVQYTGFSIFRIQTGHFKEPFSMERLTSVRDLSFMERSLASELAPDRNTGLELHAHTRNWTAAAGLFIPGTASSNTDLRHAVSSRATSAPRSDNGNILHFGGSFSHRWMGSSKQVQFRQRPETRGTDERLIDTGVFLAHDYTLYGIEAAYAHGPWALQGEYTLAHMNRAGGGRNLLFQGWHIDATWLITGERQPYNHEKGTFGRIRPDRDAGQGGGIGALQFGVRFSGLDLNSADVRGGRLQNLSANLTWYVNDYVTMMGEYVQTLDINGGQYDGARPSIVQTRVQFVY